MKPIDYWIENPQKASQNMQAFKDLISPEAESRLETLAHIAQQMTQMNFGKTIQLYTPLYLSNECINTCTYCGFSAPNKIRRKTLTPDQVLQEAHFLHQQGFRHLLLVSGEDPRVINLNYLEQILIKMKEFIPSITLEIAPQDLKEYEKLKSYGAEGIVVYQETYNRELYGELHPKGIKQLFDYRYHSLERAAKAGLKRLGAGILLGLYDWRQDSISLVEHVIYLMNQCWKNYFTISLPRLRKAAGDFNPLVHVSDLHFFQLILALRITLPQVGIILSTRETPELRDQLLPYGITQMSAGSKTEPGGYLFENQSEKQFSLEDNRTALEVATTITDSGYEAVWKNWEKDL